MENDKQPINYTGVRIIVHAGIIEILFNFAIALNVGTDDVTFYSVTHIYIL